MTREVVHDNQIAWVKRRRQQPLAETGKARSVHWSVEYHRGAGAVQGDCLHKRTDLPLATGDCFDEALTAVSPTAKPREVGFQTCFIKKHQSLWIDLLLTGAPVAAFEYYVWPILFAGA